MVKGTYCSFRGRPKRKRETYKVKNIQSERDRETGRQTWGIGKDYVFI